MPKANAAGISNRKTKTARQLLRKLERARELEQHRTSTNPILLNLHKENAE